MDLLSVFLDAFVFLLFMWLGTLVLHSQRQEYTHAQRQFLQYYHLQQQELYLKELLERQQRICKQMQEEQRNDRPGTPSEEVQLPETHPGDVKRGGQPEPGTTFYFQTMMEGVWNKDVLICGWELTPREYDAIDGWLFDALEHVIVSADNGTLVLGFERATEPGRDTRGRPRVEPEVILMWEDLEEIQEGLQYVIVDNFGMPPMMPSYWADLSLQRWILTKAAEMRRTYAENELSEPPPSGDL